MFDHAAQETCTGNASPGAINGATVTAKLLLVAGNAAVVGNEFGSQLEVRFFEYAGNLRARRADETDEEGG